MGGRWSRHKIGDEEDRAKYEALTKNSAKRKFREDWAKKNYDKHVLQYQHTVKEPGPS